jgi:hypothetical protein
MMAQPATVGRHEETTLSEEEGGSIFGGLGEAAEAAWDAGVNVGGAAIDLAQAGGEAVLGGVAHVEAGALRAVGADGLADDIQSGADVLQDYAAENVAEAGAELNQAGEDVWGS